MRNFPTVAQDGSDEGKLAADPGVSQPLHCRVGSIAGKIVSVRRV
jgi:hypothetical protein